MRQQVAYRQTLGCSYNCVEHPRPVFKGNISVADCMPLFSLLKTIKIKGGWRHRMHVVYEKLHCWRVYSWSSLLQGTPRRSAADCVDRRPVINKRRSTMHRWRCRLSHMLLQKYSKNQHIFAYSGLLGLPYISWKVLVELMWSSNWHVTLRLTVFETFAVKWLFRGQKTDHLSFFGLAFGDHWRYRRQKGRLCVRVIPPCKLSRRSLSPSRRYM